MEPGDQEVPIASAAAWSPHAAPAPKFESKILTLDDPLLREHAAQVSGPAPEPEPVAPPAPKVDRLGALRDIARRLRSAPESEDTLQFIIDTACAGTGSDAGMLTLQAAQARQFVCGTALGAGPYISMPLRAGGPSFGEIVLTRLSEREEYSSEDEALGELIAEYVARALSGLRRGTVISQEEQDFIDRVTEEIRSPLASTVNVLGVVTGGEAGPLTPDAEKYLTAAYADARRLLGSMQDLMTLAHLRPVEPREMETVPVGPWLSRAVARHQETAEAKGVNITYRAVPEAYMVSGVPAQLDTVADQLVGNAVKFTESGGRVDVTAGLAEGMLRITVRDTGIGFDAGEAGRMTDCFARATNAEAARIPGLGVGLFLANEIVKHHGGRLWLDSARDSGTQAHVALPPRTD